MSSAEGKSWTRERIFSLAAQGPLTVLDVGPGVGTYAKLLAGPHLESITGLEIWEPYIATYRLADYYNDLIVGDVRAVDLPRVDVVILGDVLEHMTMTDAVEVWRRCAAAAAQAVFLSLPIIHYPQAEIEGNPYEVHVDEDWDHERVLATFEGIGEFWTGQEVGVYQRLTAG